jgi:CRP-like cAMP-binding protein
MVSVEYVLILPAILVGILIFKAILRYLRGGLRKMPRGRAFGVEWAVKYADREAVKKVRPIYDSVRMKERTNVRIATSLSGSAAYMGRTNPYPADLDFMEIVLVRAPNIDEAARYFVELLNENIEKLLSLDCIRFSELKIGADPTTGKGLKWNLAETRRGWKAVKGSQTGGEMRITLPEAVLQRQMIKLDVLSSFDGDWKGLTKVFRLAYRPESSRATRNIQLLTNENLIETIYQEIFFSRKEAKLASLISRVNEKGGYSSPAVMEKYRDLMDVELAHYGALGMAGKMSHLKLIKRWFNKLRLERDYRSVDALSVVFVSAMNALNEIKEMMGVLVLAVERRVLSFDEISAQLGRFDELFNMHCGELLAENGRVESNEFLNIKGLFDRGDHESAIERLQLTLGILEDWIEEKAKRYLVKEILNPYAERLGIHVDRDSPLQGKDLFKGITEGSKMRYLVNRYLRDDPRIIRRSFKKGETIIQFGETAVSCYIIVGGWAVVCDAGGDLVHHRIRDVGPYTLIGEIALLHKSGHRTAKVVARTGVEIMEIPRAVFLELLEDKSFRMFIDFLTTDRLMEDRAREKQKRQLSRFFRFR